MRQTFSKLFPLLGLLLLSSSGRCYAQQSPQVAVKVSQLNNSNGSVRYLYRVINQAPGSVVAVIIGRDYYHGISDLVTPPFGWSFDSGLPASSVLSPAGWHATVVTTEESPKIEVEWRSGGPGDDIGNGQQRVFSVLVSQADDKYRSSHWTTIFGDSTTASATLTADDNPPPVDTTPPTINVTLTPNTLWPPNHKMVQITANVTATDDQDPNPVVKLVSVTCNDRCDPQLDVSGATSGTDVRTFAVRAERRGQNKPGRVYKVTYSATDAAGNTATASASVTIPHDQRN